MSEKQSRHRRFRESWMTAGVLGWLWIAVPTAVVAYFVPILLEPSVQRTFTSFLIFATITVGFSVFSGNAGVLSFGHAAFVGLGAYAGGILIMDPGAKSIALPDLPGRLTSIDVPLPVALVLSAFVVGALALVPGIVIARMTPSVAVIGTFALLVIVHDVLIGAKSITRGNQTFFGIPPVATITTCGVVLITVVLLARLYRESPRGIRLRASREDVLAARVAGISVERERLYAWLLSAVICGVGGALYGAFVGAFSPKTFYFDLSFSLLAMLLVGGWTTVSGAVVGAGTVVAMTYYLDKAAAGPGPLPVFPDLTEVGVGVVILLILLVRRDGILGLDELDERALRWWHGRRAAVVEGSLERPETVTVAPARAASQQVDRAASIRLEVEGVHKAFAGVSVLRGVDLSIAGGEIVGIIGPNGCGKTTLVNVITGLITSDAGRVCVADADITNMPPRQVSHKGLARTFQGIRVFKALSADLNVRAVSRVGDRRIVAAESAELLEMVGLGASAHRPAGTLPYGAQRRLEIARALAANPAFLLLDEPAAGLNEDESDELMALLRKIRAERGVGIMLIDHDLRLMLRTCDRIVVINEGKVIASGLPEEIRKDPRVISAYLGSKYEIEESSMERSC